jgi:hypothetical protein
MPPLKDHLDEFHGRWDAYDITFMITMIVKQGKFKYTNKGDELYDVPTCCMKILKYDPC